MKYPLASNTSQVALITKVAIAEAVGVDRTASYEAIRRVHPAIEILEVATRTGVGLDAWIALLEARLARRRSEAIPVGAGAI